jgi:hypothetical protein
MFRGQEALAILCATIPVFPPTLIVLLALELSRTHVVCEPFSLSASLILLAFCSAGEQCLGNPRHGRPNLPHSMRGCIKQPPVVKAHPGPLGRECLVGGLSSYSVSLSRCYPVDEASDDNAVIPTNGEIAAFLFRSQSMPSTASRGRRWSILQMAPDHAHT